MGTIQKLTNSARGLRELVITYMPGEAGYNLRRKFWRKRLKFLGKNVRIDPGAYFENPEYISLDDNAWVDRGVMILAGPETQGRPSVQFPNPNYEGEPGYVTVGKSVHLGPYSLILGAGGVQIGDLVGFAAGVRIYSITNTAGSDADPSNTNYLVTPRGDPKWQHMYVGPITIGENTGLAANAVVLPGVHIPRRSAVLLNTLVKDSFPENSIIAGQPFGKVLGPRFRPPKPKDA